MKRGTLGLSSKMKVIILTLRLRYASSDSPDAIKELFLQWKKKLQISERREQRD